MGRTETRTYVRCASTASRSLSVIRTAPWTVLLSEHRTIKRPDGVNFCAWAHEQWPAPRWSVSSIRGSSRRSEPRRSGDGGTCPGTGTAGALARQIPTASCTNPVSSPGTMRRVRPVGAIRRACGAGQTENRVSDGPRRTRNARPSSGASRAENSCSARHFCILGTFGSRQVTSVSGWDLSGRRPRPKRGQTSRKGRGRCGER